MSQSQHPLTTCRPRGPVPEIRPFRALRYDLAIVPDLGLVVAPPYDVIGPDEHERLLARHPLNVVRLDLPSEEQGDEPDDRYRRTARNLAAWRSDGTLHKDPHPSIYVYEQTYRVPGSDVVRTQRGFFARLRLEAFGPGSSVLPHERTLPAAREDRYKLLRATGVNTSPVIVLYEDRSAAGRAVLDAVTASAPTSEIEDDEGVRHRLWAVPADGEDAARVAPLISSASDGPVFIADGHHRYETALRYRDERRMSRSCEEDPAFDYLLTLFVDFAEQLTVLPTHRVVHGVGDDAVGHLLGRLDELFDVRRDVGRDELIGRFESAALSTGGAGVFGLWTRRGGLLLTARRDAFESLLPQGSAAVRGLDVTLLGVALECLARLDPDAVASGSVRFTKSAAEAVDRVDRCVDGADAAFLLEPTPITSVLEVARDGDVMPQKSTYFYPKALTGLVINPHEW